MLAKQPEDGAFLIKMVSRKGRIRYVISYHD